MTSIGALQEHWGPADPIPSCRDGWRDAVPSEEEHSTFHHGPVRVPPRGQARNPVHRRGHYLRVRGGGAHTPALLTPQVQVTSLIPAFPFQYLQDRVVKGMLCNVLGQFTSFIVTYCRWLYGSIRDNKGCFAGLYRLLASLAHLQWTTKPVGITLLVNITPRKRPSPVHMLWLVG